MRVTLSSLSSYKTMPAMDVISFYYSPFPSAASEDQKRDSKVFRKVLVAPLPIDVERQTVIQNTPTSSVQVVYIFSYVFPVDATLLGAPRFGVFKAERR